MWSCNEPRLDFKGPMCKTKRHLVEKLRIALIEVNLLDSGGSEKQTWQIKGDFKAIIQIYLYWNLMYDHYLIS